MNATPMVKKVAVAIGEKVQAALSGGPPVALTEVAKAAIEAMREPTDEMKAACMAPRIGSPMESYTAMIDAALGIPNPRNHP